MSNNRNRNNNGQYRNKRDDAHVGNIEKMYGVDFGVRGDMHLGTLMKKLNVNNIEDLISKARNSR